MADDPAEAPTIPNSPGAVNRMPRVERSGPALEPRFQHVREIARGGMGRVIEAFDSQLGRIVAVKESLDDSRDARLRFEREVSITARLEHPSIVPVYDAGVSADGSPFYVMRKVTGAPLDQLIRKATSLDQRLLLLPNVLAAADAVAHAHLRGVIHRDLKPSNILVGDLGETVVIDWGLAKAIDETDVIGERIATGDPGHALTFAGTVFGTPGFMAPEQVTGSATDERTDVYALGATLHYLLAAQTPFHGSTEAEVLARTSEGRPDELDNLIPGLPPDLVTIARKAMARDPAARYLDAGGFSEDLRRFLGGRLVASHHYRPAQRVARWIRKHRALVAAIAIGVVIAGAIGVVSLRRVFDEQARTAAALASERERGDELVISQAIGLLERDPTRAVATLHGLRADSPRWASLGPLLADARARGIAVGYPGHGRLAFVRFAPGAGDSRILTSGGGVARLHDLSARTSKILAEGGFGLRAWWCGSLVMLTGRTRDAATQLLDPRTGASGTVAWPTAISRIYAAPGVIAFLDNQKRVVSLAVDGLPLAHEPVVVPGAQPASWIDLSPSGRWLIVAGTGRTQLFRRAGVGWAGAGELPYEVTAFAFDANEQRIAVAYASDVLELELETLAERRRWTGVKVSALVYVGTVPHVLARNEAGNVIVRLGEAGTLSPPMPVKVVGVLPQDLAGSLAVLEDSRHVTIDGPGFRRIIRPPVELTGISADPRGRYLVGISNAGILAWDLAHVVPEQATVPLVGSLSYVDATTLVSSAHHGGAPPGRQVSRYRVRHAPFGLEAIDQLRAISETSELHVAAPGVVFTRDRITNRVQLRMPELALPATATELLVMEPTSVLVGDDAGAIVRFALAGGPPAPVTVLPASVGSMAAAGGWLAAQAADGTLWRRDPAGVESRTSVTGQGVKLGISVTSDGTVHVARDRELLAWRATGAPAVEATVPFEIAVVHSLRGDRVALMTREGSLHLHDPVTRAVRTVYHATHALVGAELDVSADGRFAAVRADSGLAVIDLASGEQWSLADGFFGGALALAPDGRYLIASAQLVDHAILLRFDLTPPVGSLAWIEAATNALPPRTARSAIEWRF